MNSHPYEKILMQLTNSTSVDANWVFAGVCFIAGVFIMMQLKDLKDAVKGNSKDIEDLRDEVGEIKTDVAVIKHKLQIE